MKKLLAWTAVAAALAVAGGVVARKRPVRALRSATGLTAHHLCAAAFMQHLDVDATFRELVRPMTSYVARLLRYEVDLSSRVVTASALGLFPARAAFTDGFGCRVIVDPRLRAPDPVVPPSPSPPDGFAPATAVEAADPRLRAVLDRLFTERVERHVKAAVIVKDGRVVAERYAPGFGVGTPLASHSVAKAFTNAFLGILVRQGRARVDQLVGAPEWSAPGDPRAALTLDDLLRMQSGTSAAESGQAFDAATEMMYAQDDMAGFAARFPLATRPRAEWRYASADTMVLARALGGIVGGGAAGFRAFAERELLQPLRMDGVTLEFDGTGVFFGASHVYAPARAYARLGLLYLDDGVAPDGRRVLPEGWVASTRRSTLGAPYGAGFWTNDGPSELAASLVAMGFPRDGFHASGNRGQRIYIVPSERLVMARFGYTHTAGFDVEADLAVLRTAVEVLRR